RREAGLVVLLQDVDNDGLRLSGRVVKADAPGFDRGADHIGKHRPSAACPMQRVVRASPTLKVPHYGNKRRHPNSACHEDVHSVWISRNASTRDGYADLVSDPDPLVQEVRAAAAVSLVLDCDHVAMI